MISARLQPLSRELELAVSGDLAPAERSKLIAQVAREDIAEIDRTNDSAVGTDVKYRTFVDGSASGRLDVVNPDHGTIAATWDLGTDVVVIVGEMLRQHSPVGSGRDPHPGLYKSSHILFADGVQVRVPDPKLSAREWVYISSLPYSRKIERGQSSQAPGGVYEAVAALARHQFGGLARIDFSFLAIGGGQIIQSGKYAGYRPKTKGKRREGQPHNKPGVRFPAITIRMK